MNIRDLLCGYNTLRTYRHTVWETEELDTFYTEIERLLYSKAQRKDSCAAELSIESKRDPVLPSVDDLI